MLVNGSNASDWNVSMNTSQCLWFTDNNTWSIILPQLYIYDAFMSGFNLLLFVSLIGILTTCRLTSSVTIAYISLACSTLCSTIFHALDANWPSCVVPVIVNRLFHDAKFNLCLTAYYMILHLWVHFLSKVASFKTGRPSDVQMILVFLVLEVPSVILRILQQVYYLDRYVLINNIYLLSFAVMVVCLNVFFEVKGSQLLTILGGYATNNAMAMMRIKVMIFGTLMISIVFVSLLVLEAALGWQNRAVSWLGLEVGIHVCCGLALMMESIVLLPSLGLLRDYSTSKGTSRHGNM
eukprot:TRINITY_DN2743_c0_g2_i5.p1 TRINITY_DN2743_c0_g2~~TRINITY_DN2743_c0_g2_i5.p1  ORF type:complete len:294 (-),score=15.14 TRINITY_DN2743_c0_g2_i5:229-1110(-)